MLKEMQHGVPLTALLDMVDLSRARVLAGRQSLGQRIVRSVTLLAGHSTLYEGADEKPSSLRTLQAGQLVLVDLAAPAAVQATCPLIEQAAQSHCAALVLYSSTGSPVPPSWIEQAEALGLPLLELPSDAPPAELISPLVDELIRREHALLYQTTNIQQRMVSPVLTGKGGQGIVEVLFSLLQQSVLLIDDSAAILGQAGAWHRHPAWEILSNPERLYATIAPLAERVRPRYALGDDFFPLIVGSAQLLLMPVIVNDNLAGWFILDAEPAALDASACLALDQAAMAAALEVGKQAAIQEVEWRLRSSLLDELLAHDKTDEDLDRHARRLGWDLSHKRAVMLISWDNPELSPQLWRRVAAEVKHSIHAWQPQSLVLERETEILILPDLAEVADEQAARVTMQTLAKSLLKDWPDYLKDVALVVAIGGLQSSLEEIMSSYREARRALAVRRRMGLRNPLVSFDEMRIYSFLERHLEDEEMTALFRRTISPLADYDAKHQTELVRTMEVHFDCNLRLQQAAEQLFIHPSSLKYRLQRIRDILGADPFTDRNHLYYYLATKFARLL